MNIEADTASIEFEFEQLAALMGQGPAMEEVSCGGCNGCGGCAH
ncbi:MAG TPA: hypothetical protein VGS19_20500 [Streptosporangiaceae bacterium]|nr:hypothetical protein [Streptosporangiaceae bacterium]